MIFIHACGMALQMHGAVSQLVGYGPDGLSTIIGWKFSTTILDSQMNLNDLACGLCHPHDDILTRGNISTNVGWFTVQFSTFILFLG